MRFDGDWNKVLLNRCDHFGIGINRLTDGTGKDSTTFVVGRQIDVTPEDEGFIFLLRGFETFKNAVVPVDGAPGNGFDAKRIDGGMQLLGGSYGVRGCRRFGPTERVKDEQQRARESGELLCVYGERHLWGVGLLHLCIPISA